MNHLIKFFDYKNVKYISNRNLSAINKFTNHVSEQLDSIKAAGTFKNERVITSKQGSHIKVASNKNSVLNFCANNYLGLAVCLFKLCFIF